MKRRADYILEIIHNKEKKSTDCDKENKPLLSNTGNVAEIAQCDTECEIEKSTDCNNENNSLISNTDNVAEMARCDTAYELEKSTDCNNENNSLISNTDNEMARCDTAYELEVTQAVKSIIDHDVNEESTCKQKTVPQRSRSNSCSSLSSSSSSCSSSTATNSTNAMPNTSKQDTTVRPNYRISPIHTDESDVDLSDSDPTFEINKNKPLSSDSQSSSDPPSEAQNQNTDEPKKKRRKRLRDPSKWKQNIIKNLRNFGKAYVSLTKKQVSARSMKDPCTSKCRLKCAEKIVESERVVLFNSYYKLGSLELQRAYIRSCLMEVIPKYKYTNAQKPRLPNHAFYFTVNEQRIRVCKQFYINTLDISDRQIRTVKAKTDNQGFLEPEKRGKHDNRKRINSDLLQDIKDHINSIPRIESHYLRSTIDKEYISDGKTIKDLCNDFNKKQRENNRTECDYWMYLNTFNKDFNIGFYQPKKDRCETCLSYELAPLEIKNNLKTNYDDHLIEKKLCREEKKKDRENVDDNHVCAIYDLQSVMLCPSPSYFYYASKINCLDFTITQLNAKETSDNKSYGDVFCYFWDETQGNRGANEIGSCVFDYFKKIDSSYPNGNVHVTFYSDNCTGQNKNKMIASLYSFAVVYFENIQSITHKYLIKGHTQNEADNVHSLIEKEIKKNEKGGPIYAPCQYATIIKSARKSGKPFTVKELNHDFFLNLKQLQDQWGYNYNENVDKEKLNWTDIKILKFVKNELFMFQYKTSYLQSEFKTVNMRNKRKKMLGADEIVIENLYEQPLALKENKKKDLKDLVRKNLIPIYYAAFYNSL